MHTNLPTIGKATQCSDPTDSGAVDIPPTEVDNIGRLIQQPFHFFPLQKNFDLFSSISMICASWETRSPLSWGGGR